MGDGVTLGSLCSFTKIFFDPCRTTNHTYSCFCSSATKSSAFWAVLSVFSLWQSVSQLGKYFNAVTYSCLVFKENQATYLKRHLWSRCSLQPPLEWKVPGPQNECYLQCPWSNLALTVNLKILFPLFKQRIACPHWVISTSLFLFFFFTPEISVTNFVALLLQYYCSVHSVHSINCFTFFSSSVFEQSSIPHLLPA